MSGSLREELLKLGLGKARSEGQPAREKRARGEQGARKQRQSRAEAAVRAGAPNGQAVQDTAARRREERALAREREARRVRLRERVEQIKLDDPLAEVKRYFSTGKKVKWIYVTPAQEAALERGEIVIVVTDGHGRLVDASHVAELREIDPEVRIVDPAEAAGHEDDGVPDDLRW